MMKGSVFIMDTTKVLDGADKVTNKVSTALTICTAAIALARIIIGGKK